MNVTQRLGQYVKRHGIAVTVLARNTGIPYGRLQPALKEGSTREMTAEDFLAVCEYLGKDPMELREEA